MDSEPKVFLSYSRITVEYAAKIRSLADMLVQNGVDVCFDQYDVPPRGDVRAYTEAAVADASIDHVLLLCDREYCRLAEEGGKELHNSSVLTQELYVKAAVPGASRCVAVVMERGKNGEPYFPAFVNADDALDYTAPDGLEQVLRFLSGKPLAAKPPLGKMSRFLTAQPGAVRETAAAYVRAMHALRTGNPAAAAFVEDYLEALGASMDAYALDETTEDKLKDVLADMAPVRDELVDVLCGVAKHDLIERLAPAIKSFLERLMDYTEPRRADAPLPEPYRFFVHEAYLNLIAVLLDREQFAQAREMLHGYCFARGPRPTSDFSDFYYVISGLGANAYDADVYNRNELFARAEHRRDIGPDSLAQADFFLYLYYKLHPAIYSYWYPVMLINSNRNLPYPLFARATSKQFFSRFNALLGADSLEQYKEALRSIDLSPLKFRINANILGNAEFIATQP